jgi:hypothetical protein
MIGSDSKLPGRSNKDDTGTWSRFLIDVTLGDSIHPFDVSVRGERDCEIVPGRVGLSLVTSPRDGDNGGREDGETTPIGFGVVFNTSVGPFNETDLPTTVMGFSDGTAICPP